LSFWKRKKGTSCTSGNWKNRMPDFFPLIAGMVLTILAIIVARHRISTVERDILGQAAPTEIVVAASPIPTGATFSLENLSKRAVPAAGTSRRNVPASDYFLLLGARAKVEISDGEPVLWTDVEEPFTTESFSLTITKGRRAMTVEADRKASFSGLLRPGDHVDLLKEEKDHRGFTPLLSHVPVLAVNRHFLPLSSERAEEEIDTITVSVTPDEATRLSAAARGGSIAWLLRNPGDPGTPKKRKGVFPKSHPPIEIWKAGIRERIASSAFHAWDLE
jgi:pilus assembly protein CpaB